MSTGNKKRNSKRQEANYQQYKVSNKRSENKKKKIARHLKNHPNDKNAERVLNQHQNSVFSYSRKPAIKKVWSPETKALAHFARKKLGKKGNEVLQWNWFKGYTSISPGE